jgi:uridine kinase
VSETYGALLARLANAIAALHPDRRIRVAIDGVDGAGKTVLADALAPLVIAEGCQVIRASVDDFHHPRAVRYARGRYSPDGFFLDSYDYPAFRRLLLECAPAQNADIVIDYNDLRAPRILKWRGG